MSAGEIFEGEQDENEGGNFQHPKRKHRHGVRHEKLQQGREHHGKQKQSEREPIRRQDEILAQAQNEKRERNRGDREVGDASRKEQAKSIPQVIDGFEQELADVAVLDIGGDLPIVFI